ncbi:LacI family DNA-binding transcriptional regulator [Limosilactobacillus fermentum]|uniref:LacI family DNA-binding transcriptional regulator n=2 Tax=Limosilactobacillus fermentum TaxID=1613 RepID=UPI000E54C5CB|nr:LacI family DNA-binding transcriptional regulator [Limosilactobacillus fermentum]RGU52938.1 LacI family DNA-binding transcriptional regulator [Limosilactobacillus fermentum]
MATIKDIAKLAGVSISTASRALNDNPRISEATRTKVKQIAAELGYSPNYNAQTLTRGEANMVGLVFPVTDQSALANPFHIDLMRGAGVALEQRHYTMMVAITETEERLLETVKSMVTQSKVHNFLLLYTKEKDPVTDYLRDAGMNFVVIGHPEKQGDRFVDNDNIQAGFLATQKLLDDHHCQHVAFVTSPHHWTFEVDRRLGCRQCLNERGLGGTEWVVEEDNAPQFFAQHPEIDGLVCADDILFLQIYRQLEALGRQDQLAIICFNNSRLLGRLLPAIDRVDLRPRQLGIAAVELLFNRQADHQFISFALQ